MLQMNTCHLNCKFCSYFVSSVPGNIRQVKQHTLTERAVSSIITSRVAGYLVFRVQGGLLVAIQV